MEVKKGQKWLLRNKNKQVRIKGVDEGMVSVVNLNENPGKIEYIEHAKFIYQYRILTDV